MIPEKTSKINALVVVRLTPPGRGAVAVLLLQGPDAVDVFARHWIGPVIEIGFRQFFGRFRLENGLLEEAVVYAPNRNEIEIHCHGGEAVTAAITGVLTADGAESVDWQPFWDSSFCSGDGQKELALKLLPSAPTERCAQILLDQYNGALEQEISEIEQRTDLAEIRRRRTRLEENARLARHLVEPFRVVLAGPANAGKSSLLNAVLGFQRAIVAPDPGTTRDTVSGRTALDGFPVEFVDTAGFRETHHELERQGMERSRRSLDEADLVLWVVDITDGNAEAMPERENFLRCWNKIDLSDGTQKPTDSNTLYVSAATGEGVEALLERVIRKLVPRVPEPLEGVPLSEVLAKNAGE